VAADIGSVLVDVCMLHCSEVSRCTVVMWLRILVVSLLICVCGTVRKYHDARCECENYRRII